MCQKNQGPFREKMLENQQKLRKHEIDHSNRLNFWWVFLLFFFQRNSGFHLSIWTRFNMEKQHVTDLKEVGWWFFVGSFNSPNTKSEAHFLWVLRGCCFSYFDPKKYWIFPSEESKEAKDGPYGWWTLRGWLLVPQEENDSDSASSRLPSGKTM